MGCGSSKPAPPKGPSKPEGRPKPEKEPEKEPAPQEAAKAYSLATDVPDLSIVKLQARIRGRQARKTFKQKTTCMVRLQAGVRGRRARHLTQEAAQMAQQALDDAALKLQCLVRGGSRWREQSARTSSSERSERIDVLMTKSARIKMDRQNTFVRRINDYSLGTLLGTGAYGKVYKARAGGQDYAIKVMTRSLLKQQKSLRRPTPGSSPDAEIEQVMREISVMKRLSHPNCVQLFEVIDDPDQGELYLVMEYVAGGTLAASIESKRHVGEEELRSWMRDLIQGLEHLHLNGICHRDVKPENILWSKKEERAKLADFGVSAIMTSNTSLGGDYTHRTGGTPPFFAPEMCATSEAGGYSMKAADLWACGVCLFMWMYHRPPYEAPTAHLLMEKIRTEEVAFPEDTTASAPLLELLHGLLERQPNRRYKLGEIRRDAWITDNGQQPLPNSRVTETQTVASMELVGAITRVKEQLKISRSLTELKLMRTSSEDTGGGAGGGAGAPTAAAPAPAAEEYSAAPAPAGEY